MKYLFSIEHTRTQIVLITLIASVCYFPFINKATHIDSDMLIHTAHQILIDPINPPLGEYGRNMVLHDHTQMPETSVYYRCGHPPLLPMMLAGVIVIFGDQEWIYHFAFFGFYLTAIYSVWALLNLFFSPLYRFSGTVLWTISPSLLINSHNIMWDVPIAAMMLLSFVLFLKGLRKNAPMLILFSGIVAGLAALTKVNALALYLLCGPYLLAQRRWKFLLLWCLPSISLPLIWVVHNLVVFQKIHYISIGWYDFRIGDVRYRIERFVAFFGGALFLPLFWLWLILTQRHYRSLLITSIVAAFWAVLLIVVLKKPVWLGVSFFLFASSGLWLFYRSFVLKVSNTIHYKKNERLLIGLYAIFYTFILVILPSASVRYMLPMLPVALIVLGEEIQSFTKIKVLLFLSITIVATFTMSIGLAAGDYFQCDADRKLPQVLIKKGYSPQNTWYYGRLSFDYYLTQYGFKNLRIESGTPKSGDFLIEILIPGDYIVTSMIAQDLKPFPLDTINFYPWPLRTMGFYGGFYGNDRLPYSIQIGKPQKSYCVYQLK